MRAIRLPWSMELIPTGRGAYLKDGAGTIIASFVSADDAEGVLNLMHEVERLTEEIKDLEHELSKFAYD
jgi:hypothetical protein